MKGEAEDAVADLEFPAAHLFRPSVLIGERAERRPGERAGLLAARALRPLLSGPLRKYRAVPARVVADGMRGAARLGVRGVYYYEGEAIERAAREVA